MPRIDEMPYDPQLPQLNTVTDTATMREVFQEQLPGFAENRLLINRLKLIQFSYNPGKRCSVGYLLAVRDIIEDKEGHQIFFGVMKPESNIRERLANAIHDDLVEPEFGPPVFALPQLDMVLWGFPNDAHMKQLPLMIDNTAFAETLQQHWDCFRLSPEVQLKNTFTEVVKYVPQSRCTLRHKLHLSNSSDLIIYSKTFATRNFSKRTYLTMQALWNATRNHTNEMYIPEPFFYKTETNTIFMRGVSGENLDSHLDKIDLPSAVAGIGSGLARIHRCEVEDLPVQNDHIAVAKLAQAETFLSKSDAAFKPRVEAITEDLLKRYHNLTPVEPTPIHGAFRLSQLLLVNGNFVLIDFDDFLMANPILDITSFIGHLLYLTLKGKLPAEECYVAIPRFCQAYEKQASRKLPEDQLIWHTAAQLVSKQAKKCVRLGKKDYHKTVNRLFDMAEGILGGEIKLN